jgi:hypothetical protein
MTARYTFDRLEGQAHHGDSEFDPNYLTFNQLEGLASAQMVPGEPTKELLT